MIETSAVPTVGDEAPTLTPPAHYDDWLADLIAVADTGLDPFAQAWKDAPPDARAYLLATEPEAYESLKQKAAAISTQATEASTHEGHEASGGRE